MAKTNRTDKIRADLSVAFQALVDVKEALDTGDAEQMAAAAKTLEAFGCYVRRTKVGD